MFVLSVLAFVFASVLPTVVTGSTLKRAVDANRDATTAPTHQKLRVVENSGICETAPDVYQASGYGDIAANKSIWFWFFAARKNPDTAPLIAWFNGDHGGSSMLGLFQELGPCRINNQSTGVDLNPMSWNTNANVIFIDQPVGTGFSYGNGSSVGTSQEAAADVWDFLQMWFADERFEKYAAQKFGIWTESGDYGPAFAAYFLEKNDEIRHGKTTWVHVNLEVLGVGNGFIDPISQYLGYIEYAESNPYQPLVNGSVISTAKQTWQQTGGCKDQITACNNGGTDFACLGAQVFCNEDILLPLEGIWDPYYVPTQKLYLNLYPPVLDAYLNSDAVTSKIGSHAKWEASSALVAMNFDTGGDSMRTSLPVLEKVIDAGVRTVIYAGDADYLANFVGIEAMIASMNTTFSAQFTQQNFANYTVDGAVAGIYKNAGTFSYARFFGAGHQVPAYPTRGVPRGAAALQMFTQIMSGEQLSGT